MEAVGFAASVLTLVATAIQSAKVINNLVGNFKDVPESLENLSTATDQLSNILPYFERLQHLSIAGQSSLNQIDNTFVQDLQTLLVGCNRDLFHVNGKIQDLQLSPKRSLRSKTSRAFKLLLAEHDFDEAWKRIQLYPQLFAILLGRAGINDGKLNYLTSLKLVRDSTAAVSNTILDRLDIQQASLRSDADAAKNTLNTILSEIRTQNGLLYNLNNSHSVWNTRIVQVIRNEFTNQSIAYRNYQDQSHTSHRLNLQTDLTTIQRRLENVTKSESANLQRFVDNRMNSILGELQELRTGLDMRPPQSAPDPTDEANQVTKPRPVRPKNDLSTDKYLQRSFQRLLSLEASSQNDPFAPSVRTIISDLLVILSRAMVSIETDQLLTQEVRDSVLGILGRSKNIFEHTEKLDESKPERHSLIQSESQTYSTSSNGWRTNGCMMALEEPISKLDSKFEKHENCFNRVNKLYTRQYQIGSTFSTAPMIESMRKNDRLKVASATPYLKLFNRKTKQTLNFVVEGAQSKPSNVIATRARGFPKQGTMRNFSFDLENGRIDIVAETRQEFRPDQEDGDTEYEVFTAKVILTPSKTLERHTQIVFQCLQVVNFEGQCLPGPTYLSFNNVRHRTDNVFHVAEFGTVQEMSLLFESGTAHPTDRDETGKSLLFHAIYRFNSSMILYIANSGGDINDVVPVYNEGGSSYLRPIASRLSLVAYHAGLRWRRKVYECVQTCIQLGVDLAYSDEVYHGSDIRMIFSAGTADLMRLLLDQGEILTTIDNVSHPERTLVPLLELTMWHTSPLSTIFELPDKFAILLSRKANVLIARKDGTTCLHRIFARRREYVPDRLFQNLVTPTFDGELLDILLLLISAGANVYAIGCSDISVSDIAVGCGYMREWTEALSKCGYDPDQVLARSKHNEAEDGWSSAVDRSENLRQQRNLPCLSLEEYLEDRKSRRFLCKRHLSYEYQPRHLRTMTCINPTKHRNPDADSDSEYDTEPEYDAHEDSDLEEKVKASDRVTESNSDSEDEAERSPLLEDDSDHKRSKAKLD